MSEFSPEDLYADNRLDFIRVIVKLQFGLSFKIREFDVLDEDRNPAKPLLIVGYKIKALRPNSFSSCEENSIYEHVDSLCEELDKLSCDELQELYERAVRDYLISFRQSASQKKLAEDKRTKILEETAAFMDLHSVVNDKQLKDVLSELRCKLIPIAELKNAQKYPLAIKALLQATQGLHPDLRPDFIFASWPQTISFLNDVCPSLGMKQGLYRRYKANDGVFVDHTKYKSGIWDQVFANILK